MPSKLSRRTGPTVRRGTRNGVTLTLPPPPSPVNDAVSVSAMPPRLSVDVGPVKAAPASPVSTNQVTSGLAPIVPRASMK